MNINNQNIIFHPLISAIQKVVLYETKTRLYLVGSNNRETRFRLLTIDRTQHNHLNIVEHPNEFNALGIRRFLSTLSSPKVISAYGVLGFVRFLEGYYLILVTKRKCCAHVGLHLIYTIKDTVLVKVNESLIGLRPPHPYEERYKKMFQNIDLRSNFYFSYSYDLTHTLQYNCMAPRYVGDGVDIEKDEPLPDWNTSTSNGAIFPEEIDYAFRSQSRKRFVWNAFLLEPMKNIMLKDWLLEITHGYISQSCISVFGRRVNVCLIARRSTRFAGTRFLKRGANFQGDVANEVETEQIVSDSHILCSFTQMRGSVPSHWSQDISKMVPKPPIQLDISDPYAETSARHFERLLFHYGSPIIMLNLVKKKEKRQHESIIAKELENSISYLNQFLPPQHRMKYIHFDMARKTRGGGNVMEMLADIAESMVQHTGMFFKDGRIPSSFQTGIVRTNCVDCLDRTNTAQFAIGKCALGHQLEKLGLIRSIKLDFDSDCVTMLENLYEEHGDTLALQYGGSQLVHRIKTYRKTAAWASQGNDIMQTLSRYYSNTFNDTEKQHSINLFLGYYIPNNSHSKSENQPIWELQTDYYMHNMNKSYLLSDDSRLITDWVRSKVRKCLPYSCSDSNKIVKELFRVHSKELEMIDAYSNYHQSFKWTDLSEHISYEISLLAIRYMPTFRTNFSPFRRQNQIHTMRQNPSLTGHSSISSTNSNESSSSAGDDTSTDEDFNVTTAPFKEYCQKPQSVSHIPLPSLNKLLPSMEAIYGCKVNNPSEETVSIYKRYAQMGKLLMSSSLNTGRASLNTGTTSNVLVGSIINLQPMSDFGCDSYLSIRQPIINEKSQRIYVEYCQLPRETIPKLEEYHKLSRYVSMQ